MAEAPERKDTDVVLERILAQIVDNFVAGFISTIIGAIFFGIGLAFQGTSEILSSISVLIGVLIFLAIFFGYEPFLEYRWKGQTVGKRAAGIKVVKENGGEIQIKGALLRNIPVIGFIFPYFGLFSYPAALIAIGTGNKRQRIFDKVAGTVVIEE